MGALSFLQPRFRLRFYIIINIGVIRIVYRVNEGQSVTIPGRDVTIDSKPSPAATPKSITAAAATGKAIEFVKAGAGGGCGGGAAGATELLAQFSENGAVSKSYAWSQDKTSVTIGGFVPKGTRAGSIAVKLDKKHISITVAGGGDGGKASSAVLDGDLWSDCTPPMDEDDLEWEIKDVPGDPEGRRIV